MFCSDWEEPLTIDCENFVTRSIDDLCIDWLSWCTVKSVHCPLLFCRYTEAALCPAQETVNRPLPHTLWTAGTIASCLTDGQCSRRFVHRWVQDTPGGGWEVFPRWRIYTNQCCSAICEVNHASHWWYSMPKENIHECEPCSSVERVIPPFTWASWSGSHLDYFVHMGRLIRIRSRWELMYNKSKRAIYIATRRMERLHLWKKLTTIPCRAWVNACSDW